MVKFWFEIMIHAEKRIIMYENKPNFASDNERMSCRYTACKTQISQVSLPDLLYFFITFTSTQNLKVFLPGVFCL